MAREADVQSWRMQFEVAHGTHPDDLRRELRASIPEDVVLTHDGRAFFLYATTQEALNDASAAIELATRQQPLAKPPCISHWEDDLARWLQVDPPVDEQQAQAPGRVSEPRGDQKQTQDASGQAGEEQEPDPHRGEPHAERALACVVGRLIRKSFEAEMREVAASLALDCDIVEHPHLLDTQVLFNVRGSPADIRAFQSSLNGAAKATMHIDPGLIPFGLP